MKFCASEPVQTIAPEASNATDETGPMSAAATPGRRRVAASAAAASGPATRGEREKLGSMSGSLPAGPCPQIAPSLPGTVDAAMPDAPPALELRALTKRYDDGFLALDRVD